MVTSFTTFLGVPVTANDSDPEGQPLHVAGLADRARPGGASGRRTLGVFPDFPVVIDAFDMSPVPDRLRRLCDGGDGNRASVGHWSVTLPAAAGLL